MRGVIQRVSRASVEVNGSIVGAIEHGLLALIGVSIDDTPDDARGLAAKIAGLRIFKDAQGDMNLTLAEVGGSILAVSQFTLLGDVRKGRRPSFITAARGPEASALYAHVVSDLRAAEITVETGIFGATMEVTLVNSGPVTILLDTKRLF